MSTSPDKWRVTKLKFVADIFSGGTPESGISDYWDGPVPWFTPVDLGKEGSDRLLASARTITNAGAAVAGLDLLPPGSIIVSTRAPIGSVGRLECLASINQGCKAIVPHHADLDSKFAYYLALSLSQELQSLGLGTTFLELSTQSFKNIKVRLPCLEMQRQLASFLDEQTAKIDRLIALRRRQIELLKEQSEVILQAAVTRGLNPTSSLKDSGLSWLGEIPAHWEVKKLKFVTPQVTVGIVINPSSHYVESGIPCLRSMNVRPSELLDTDLVYINEESHRQLRKSAIYKGDLVAVRTGQPGTTAVVDERFDNANCIDLIIIRRSSCFESEYLELLLNSNFAKSQFELGSDGAIQQHFNIQTAKDLYVLLPPLDEQREILQEIRREGGRLDALIDTYTHQIELLIEYRAATIQETVTGQYPAASEPAKVLVQS